MPEEEAEDGKLTLNDVAEAMLEDGSDIEDKAELVVNEQLEISEEEDKNGPLTLNDVAEAMAEDGSDIDEENFNEKIEQPD